MDEFNHFAKIAEAMDKTCGKIARKTAFDIQANAAANAPVDTGFLKNSIYVVTSTTNTYGRGVQKAGTLKADKNGVISRRRLQSHLKRQERQKAQEAMLLPPIPPPPVPNDAIIAVGANYGEFVEFGTVHQPAQPYFYPAVDAMRPSFEAAIAAVQTAMAE